MDLLSAFSLDVFAYVTLIGIIVYLIKRWVEARLVESVLAEYARQLADDLNQRDIRLKAALVGELLAEWLSKKEDRTRLNQLTFEAFLWLPKQNPGQSALSTRCVPITAIAMAGSGLLPNAGFDTRGPMRRP